MNRARVLIKRQDSSAWEDRGKHVFVSFPRIGEHIEITEEKHVGLYRVIAFHHLIDPTSQYHTYDAGEIYATWEGEREEIVDQLFHHA